MVRKKKASTPKQKEWTPARFRSFVISALRGAFNRFPTKYEVLNEAYVGQKINPKTNRESKHYQCNKCKQAFPAKEVQVNHCIPVCDLKDGFVDWNTFVERLFCGKEDLEVLCKPCHQALTKLENEERRKHKK